MSWQKITFYVTDAGLSQNTSNKELTFHFTEDLPFPLNMPYHWRVICSIYLIFIVIGGSKMRQIILMYLRAPETKSNPINLLTWFDQLSGAIFGTFNLMLALAVLIIKAPLRNYLGDDFCDWAPLTGCINITGYLVWSSLIAIYRILCIRAQNWIKYTVGEQQLLRSLVIIGLFLQSFLSASIFYFDDESTVFKVCHHYSAADLEAILHYKALNDHVDLNFRKSMVRLSFLLGGFLTFIELSCYLAFFQYIYNHNNEVAARIVSQATIQSRNRATAISMGGQIASWFMEIWHTVLVGILSTMFKVDFLREVSVLVKISQHFFIPLVQVLTSPPLKSFLKK